jgi:hypothetical protein
MIISALSPITIIIKNNKFYGLVTHAGNVFIV